MLALLDVEDKIKNFSKTIHDFIIVNTINWKLWTIKDGKDTPNSKGLNLRIS